MLANHANGCPPAFSPSDPRTFYHWKKNTHVSVCKLMSAHHESMNSPAPERLLVVHELLHDVRPVMTAFYAHVNIYMETRRAFDYIELR